MPVYILLFVAVALLSTAAGVFLWKRRSARRRESLQKAAQLLGLQFLEGEAAYEQAQRERSDEGLPTLPMPEFLEKFARSLSAPRLAGQFRGIRVAVYEEVHSSRSGSHTESVFKAYLALPLPFELQLRKEGVGAKLAKAFGGQDVTVGDAAFDAAVRVKANPPDVAVPFLRDEERRKAVLAALQAYPGIKVCRTHVALSRQGSLKGGDEIKEVLAAMVPVAAAFSKQ